MVNRTRIHAPLVMALVACSIRAAAAQMPTVKVVVGEARLIDARATISLVGTVNPRRRSRVGSELDGLVIDMPVREGDHVSAGSALVKLNDDTLTMSLAAQRARLGALRSRHAELLAGTRQADLDRLKALLDEASAELERRTFDMKRIEKLYADRNSNDKEFQDTRAEFLAAERRKIAADAAHRLAVEGPRKEVIAQAAFDVDQQKAVVDRLESDLGKTVVRAPFDGDVVRRYVEVGEWVSAGDPVVEMVDLSSVLVVVDVPEMALPFLKRGDVVRVLVDALKRSFGGRIKHIMRQADPNARTFPVEIEVDNAEGVLAGGMFARATVPAGAEQEMLAMPRDAVVQREGTTYVAMLVRSREGLTGVLVPVTLGMNVGELVTVTAGGIRPGAQVITRGTERILPFPTPVEVVDERGTPVAMPDHAKKARGDEDA